jgi:hypothetical protein
MATTRPETFTVALVSSVDEMAPAVEEIAGGGPTGYVIMRLAQGPGNANRYLSVSRSSRRRATFQGALGRRARGAGSWTLGPRDPRYGLLGPEGRVGRVAPMSVRRPA